MSDSLSAFDPPPRPRAFRLSMQGGLVLLVAALQGAPLWAEEVDGVAKSNVSSAAREEISWMSGGIGDDARDEMRKAAAAYNVHVVFSDRQGSYLAGIPFKVRHKGNEIHSGVSDGPLLYLKLAPGAYNISAEIDGVWQSKNVRASKSGSAARLSFVGKGE